MESKNPVTEVHAGVVGGTQEIDPSGKNGVLIRQYIFTDSDLKHRHLSVERQRLSPTFPAWQEDSLVQPWQITFDTLFLHSSLTEKKQNLLIYK
jgi:hypothetical protein